MQEKYQGNPDFIIREIAGEMLLVPVGNAAKTFQGLAALNETGVFLWKLLQEKLTKEEICDRFAREYELTEEESRKDVEEFLEPAIREQIILKC